MHRAQKSTQSAGLMRTSTLARSQVPFQADSVLVDIFDKVILSVSGVESVRGMLFFMLTALAGCQACHFVDTPKATGAQVPAVDPSAAAPDSMCSASAAVAQAAPSDLADLWN